MGSVDASLIRRYLLRDLSAEEEAHIEDECFSDAERFEELAEGENDLIDAYARGGLTDFERTRFEQLYLRSPRRRARVDFASTLDQIAPPAEEPTHQKDVSRWWLRWQPSVIRYRSPRLAFVAAGFLLTLIGGLWLLTQNRRLRNELEHQQAVSAELQRDNNALVDQIAKRDQASNEASSKSETAKLEEPQLPNESFTLFPGVLRGGGEKGPTIRSPVHGSSVELRLVLERQKGTNDSYDAGLQTVEGRPIFKVDNLKVAEDTREPVVLLRVPSALLQPGDYVVTLQSGQPKENIGSYALFIRKKGKQQ